MSSGEKDKPEDKNPENEPKDNQNIDAEHAEDANKAQKIQTDEEESDSKLLKDENGKDKTTNAPKVTSMELNETEGYSKPKQESGNDYKDDGENMTQDTKEPKEQLNETQTQNPPKIENTDEKEKKEVKSEPELENTSKETSPKDKKELIKRKQENNPDKPENTTTENSQNTILSENDSIRETPRDATNSKAQVVSKFDKGDQSSVLDLN